MQISAEKRGVARQIHNTAPTTMELMIEDHIVMLWKLAGLYASPRRGADRNRRKRIIKANTVFGQCIERRSFDDLVAVGAKAISSLLIRN